LKAPGKTSQDVRTEEKTVLDPSKILGNEIIYARNRGTLVIIAGAGVSVSSGIPDYEGLIHLLQSHKQASKIDRGESFDKYLGRLEQNGVPVRDIIVEKFQFNHDVESGKKIKIKPNDYHTEILRVFQRPREIKLVTLNFDNLFSEAAEDLWPGESYNSRFYNALTVGTDFKGITYLHGNIAHSCKSELVITRQDYSRAYLNHDFNVGNSSMFLSDCFRDTDRIKLIVGARFSDPIFDFFFSYWNKIESTYILLPEKNDNGQKAWGDKGVKPLIYPYCATKKSHEGLLHLFKAWNKMIQTGIMT